MAGLPGTLAPDPPGGPRAALVVATTRYEDPDLRQLRAPARDATDLAEVLGDPGIGAFTVTRVIDADERQARRAIDVFLSGRGVGDLVVVYFSCHGVLDRRNRLYFAASDTLKAQLGSTGIPAAWLMDELEECRARSKVLILDCCFSGAFARGSKGDAGLDLERRLAGHGRGQAVLTASRAGEYSFEGQVLPGTVTAGSVFTAGLVDGLRTGAADVDGDGYVSVDEAFDYAYGYVVSSGASQTPQRWLYGGEGAIVLARSPAGVAVFNPKIRGDLIQVNPPDALVRAQIVDGPVPQKPKGYQPRDELLTQLHHHVGVAGAALVNAVTGAPGVGKTLLAAAYAWHCQQAAWPVVAWIPAETASQVLNGMATLGKRLGEASADDSADDAAVKARDWLSATTTPALIVFDNATDLADIRRWSPATGAARIVITTRNRIFSYAYDHVEVGVFGRNESTRLLDALTALGDDRGALALAEELGHLPLALTQAGTFIRRMGIDYAEYLERMRSFPLTDQLSAGPAGAYPVGSAKAILLSVGQAETSIGDARAWLETLAVLAPAGVLRTLVYGSVDANQQTRQSIDAVLADLIDTSLVALSTDRSTFVMHRLVQRVIRERAAAEGRLPTSVANVIAWLVRFDDSLADRVLTAALRPIVDALAEQIDVVVQWADKPSAAQIALRSSCANHLIALADVRRAIPQLEHARTESSAVHGAHDPRTLAVRHQLGYAYTMAGQLDKGIAELSAVSHERARVLGSDHVDTLATDNALAFAYASNGDHRKAQPLLERTLARREQLLGPTHPDTLTSRNDLGYMCIWLGEKNRAIELLTSTLRDRARVLGADHPDTHTTRHNLGYAYIKADRPDEAIAMLEEAAQARESLLGADHPDTLQSRHHLAGAHHTAGDLGTALQIYEEVSDAYERTLGQKHLDTLHVRRNIAGLYEDLDDDRTAEALYRQLIADYTEALGADHPYTRHIEEQLDQLQARDHGPLAPYMGNYAAYDRSAINEALERMAMHKNRRHKAEPPRRRRGPRP
jgi:Tetratricopeptide repeat/Caspase domain